MADFKIRTTLNTIKKQTQVPLQTTNAPQITKPLEVKLPEKNELEILEKPKSDKPANCEIDLQKDVILKLEELKEENKIEDKKDNILFLANELKENKEKTIEERKAEVELKRQLWMQLKKDTMLEARILNKPTDKRREVSKLNLIKARQARTEQAIQKKREDAETKKKLDEYLDASNDDDTEDSDYKDEINLGRKAYKQKQKILEQQKHDELASLKEMIFLQNKRNEKLSNQMKLLVPHHRKHYNSDEDEPRRKHEPVIINIHEKKEEKKEINKHELNKLKSIF